MKKWLLLYGITLVLFSACSTMPKITQKNLDIERYSQQLPDSLALKSQVGIDYFAAGELPHQWTLELDFDKEFVFAEGGHVIATQAIAPLSQTAELTTYSCTTPKGNLKILLYKNPCGNGQRRTQVILQGITFEGCGKYLYDFKLNDKWELESIGQRSVQAAEFSHGLPTLQFGLAKQKLSGSDGCNSLGGTFEVQGNRINFGPVFSTKMACKNNPVEKIIPGKISNQVASYFFHDGKLYLYLIDDSMLIFKKANFQ